MNFLECPYCHKQTVKFWQIFTIFSSFWFKKSCNHCNKKIIFNSKTILFFYCAIIFWVILGNSPFGPTINKYSTLVDILMLFSIAGPIFLGMKLFKKPGLS